MFETDVQLSFEGQRRRHQILRLAQQQARQRRRLRRRTSGIAASAAVTVAVMVVAWSVLLRRQHSTTPSMPRHEIAVAPPHRTPTPAEIVIVRITTDPTITSRLAIVPQKPKWRSVNDDELLRALADAGRPAGLIEFDGRAMLVPRKGGSRN